MENLIYSWSFNDKKDRSPTWYMVFLSIMIGLVIWWFFTAQYGMSFVIILLSGLIYFMENNSSEVIEIEINELWIKIDNNFYDYSKIKNFWFIYEWENATHLRLTLLKSSIRQIDLWVNNDITAELKSILPNFIAETTDSELTFTEKLIKILKL